MKVDYAYNDKNQKVFERWVRGDRPGEIAEKTFIYDERGFLVEVKGFEKNANKELGSFTLVYDKIDDRGNWLVRRTFIKDQEIRTETRTIEYYN